MTNAADAFMSIFGMNRVESPECFCMTCDVEKNIIRSRMSLCDKCGNKRCPRATHHDNECTNSNKPGQKGSYYE